MDDFIFLSASVPDPKRAPEFAESSDSVAITSAVRALVHVTLGRRVLVWGGHPAITPMIKVVADEMGVDYGKWVKLYQSLFFKDQFPEDNEAFKNVVYTDRIDGDIKESLLRMREQMFTENSFKSAIFIGGMAGIIDEFHLFQKYQPGKDIIPIVSTGGATLEVAKELEVMNPKLIGDDLRYELDYVRLFHHQLDIDVREERYSSPDIQPKNIQDRYWKPRASS
ncbi:SLOG domain-containing protein [Vibrio sp. MEBiC08052]|uniref:SLOG domain-containing protein n=1 Tax=Vibrio sp. MEBiC08052 TaxID=1761910 RepID=UPI0007407549|nr:hypothetical protein [Vibrio sp. MEBiC08052]KUJ00525.1 hypothetical protein VRK_00270 [Vibrio sp. MEBiC08052]